MAEDPDRRRFLKAATCAIGGGVGLVIVAPALRLVAAPADMQTVTSATAPIDIGAADRLVAGAPWSKVDVVAPVVQDAWTSSHDVVLGAAWLRKSGAGAIQALSATCPHLGCAVGWDGKQFLCPCHNSRWSDGGQLVAGSGPAKRDLDPLPIAVEEGRLRLTWVRYKLDRPDREPA
jgi:Rieske Fe-S protein